MRSSDFVNLDVRWREDGWHEAMRLRLTGWLPEHLVAQGVNNGVLQAIQDSVGKRLALTARGMALTEPGPHSFTSENYRQLAQILKIQGEDCCWLSAPRKMAFQYVGAPLSPAYRRNLLKFLVPTDPSNDT